MLFMGDGAGCVDRQPAQRLDTQALLAYAIIEAVIGLLGLIFDALYQAGTGAAYEAMANSGNGGQLFKWSVAVAMVLPQCVLLGATFPLMSAGFMRLLPSNEGNILSGLYFSNSIGAAIGALASTYLLLPLVGLPGAILTAALLNIAVALAVYPLSKNWTLPAASRLRVLPKAHASLLVLAVAGMTGATSFVYEITWIRMLSLALGTTVHAFELMLAAFISGIAFGGLWLRSRADKLPSPLATAGWIQVWMGVAALGSMFVYANAFDWVAWLLKMLTRTPEGYNLYNIASGIISMLVMFPAAFCAGMTLPLLTLVLMQHGGGERVIGQVYAINTLGAIIGVLAAVHILMPLLGLKQALMWAAAVDLALGIILLRVALQRKGRKPSLQRQRSLRSRFPFAHWDCLYGWFASTHWCCHPRYTAWAHRCLKALKCCTTATARRPLSPFTSKGAHAPSRPMARWMPVSPWTARSSQIATSTRWHCWLRFLYPCRIALRTSVS